MNKYLKKYLPYLRSLWPFLSKEELFKIILSFFIIIGAGGWLNYRFQKESWERQVRYELLKNEIEDGRKTITDITALVDQRLFTTQQYIWAIKDNKIKAAEDIWLQYMEAVNKWNINDEVFQNKLARMSGYETASEFLTYTDDLNNKIPTSIHYKFYKIHQYLLSLRECVYSGCDYQKNLIELDVLISTLIDQETRLLGKLNDESNIKYNQLKFSPSEYNKLR